MVSECEIINDESCKVENVYYTSNGSYGSYPLQETLSTVIYSTNDENQKEQLRSSIRLLIFIFITVSTMCLIYMWVIILRIWSSYYNYKSNEDVEEESTSKELEEVREDKKKSGYREGEITNKRMGLNVPPLLFGFGDNNYKKACRLSEMTITLLNEYMSDWYKKVSLGSEEINKWHPYLLTTDIELSGYIMVRIMNSRLENLTKGTIEYISVILSSAIFHGLLRGSKQVMNDINQLYKVRLPSNCVSVYKIKRIRSYGENQLKQAYINHKNAVRITADERANIMHFDQQIEEDNVRMYNEEMKKLVLNVLSEIDWNPVLNELVSIYTGYNVEDTESDYCLSPRHDSVETDEEYRRSFL
jgi:hypothetical protein